MEHTFVIIKPDAVKRRLIGPIISRFEQKGITITSMKMQTANESIIDKHYSEHVNKAFYPGLKEYFLSGPIVTMILSGKNVVEEVRRMIGSTNPQQAALGTIRGDYAMEVGRNIVHGSDSVESAEKEIALWFGDFEEVKSYDHEIIYEN